MRKTLFKRFISLLLAFCQFMFWSQNSFAMGEKAAQMAGQAAANSTAGAAAAENLMLGLSKVPVPPSQFKKTKLGQAIDEIYIGSARNVPPGHPLYKSVSGTVPLAAGGRVIGEVGLASDKSKNAIRMLRNLSLAEVSVGAVKQFPLEAFTFFVALGALSKGQLMMNFADNPVSFDQNLGAHDFRTAEGRLGYMGFLAFMLGARNTEHILKTLLSSKSRMLRFVPYIGMSVGLIMSNVVHEAGNIEEVKKCVASLESRVADEEKYNNCERAYDSWAEYRHEKVQQLAPTIMAMVTSTITSGIVAVHTLNKAQAYLVTGWKVVFTGTRFVANGSPVGLAVTFGGFLFKVGQFMLFTEAQELQEPSLTQWFKNVFDGRELKKLETDMMVQLDFKKKSKWKLPLEREYGDLDLSLRKLTQLSFEWRKGNMMDLVMSHQSWLSYLADYSKSYSASLDFYKNYISEYSNKYLLKRPSALDEAFLLSGVAPYRPQEPVEEGKEPKELPPLDELVRKLEYEYYQVNGLAETRQSMEEWMAKHISKDNIARAPRFYQDFNNVLAMLPTQDEVTSRKYDIPRYGKALDLINRALEIKIMYPGSNADEDYAPMDWDDIPQDADPKTAAQMEIVGTYNKPARFYQDGRELYSKLRRDIGDPVPLHDPGVGFLRAYEMSKSGRKAMDGFKYPITEEKLDKIHNGNYINRSLKFLDFIDEDSNFMRTKSNTLNYRMGSQYLISQIAMGPRADMQEGLTDINSLGFPVHFRPPRLTESYQYEFLLDKTRGHVGTRPTVFNTPVKVIGSTTTLHNSLFDVTRSQIVLPSILNHEGGFGGWWKDRVESQYIDAWQRFEESYQTIMVKLLNRYRYYYKGYHANHTAGEWWETFRRSGLQNSPYSNGLALAFRQERRFYEMVLGEIVKDHYEMVSNDTEFVQPGRANPVIQKDFLEIKGYDTATLLKQRASRCLGIAKDYATCEKQRLKSAAFNQVPFVPVLEFFKYHEAFSLSAIIASYGKETLTPYQDPFSKHHFAFQDNLENAFYDLERLIEEMKVMPVKSDTLQLKKSNGIMSFFSAKEVVVSGVSNQQLADAQKKINETTEKIEKWMTESIGKQNPASLKVIKACIAGLKAAAQQQAEIARMINAVSYERSDEKEGIKGNNICHENKMSATRIGVFGHRTTFKKKACKDKKPEVPAEPVAASVKNCTQAFMKNDNTPVGSDPSEPKQGNENLCVEGESSRFNTAFQSIAEKTQELVDKFTKQSSEDDPKEADETLPPADLIELPAGTKI
jgi:hypothetical protein